nr:venom protein [Lampona murina]
MKTFFMLSLLIASVYSAKIQAVEEDTALVDSEFQEESRGKKCANFGDKCIDDCDCCGRYGWCDNNHDCFTKVELYICEDKMRQCPEVIQDASRPCYRGP